MFDIFKKKKNDNFDKGRAGTEGKVTFEESELTLPLVPVRGIVVGTDLRTSIDLGRRSSIAAVEASINSSKLVMFCAQRDQSIEEPTKDDLLPVGCVADILDITHMHYDVVRVGVSGLRRAELISIISDEPCMMARVRLVNDELFPVTDELKTLQRIAYNKFIQILQMQGRSETDEEREMLSSPPNEFIDAVSGSVKMSYDEFYELMQLLEPTARMKKLIEILILAIKSAEIDMDIENRILMQYSQDQRTRYLREKKRVINTELNEDEYDDDLNEYQDKIEALPIAEEYKTKLKKELDRLELMPPASQEGAVIQTYLDCVIDMPWTEKSGDEFDIAEAEKILNEDHYGLEKVKDRILEYLSVVKLTDALKAPILCLVGSPGVGKTSVAKSIARAAGRKYVRLSLGGMHDEAEIRGHRKTYVGSMPGRIIAGIKQAGVKNPVFLLDEIDKISSDMRGDPAAALLEVLDPEQNSAFTDTYMEIPYDLSDVMFVTTANTLATIPEALLDRLEVIELPGYLATEKIEIAKRHLIPRELSQNGITSENITFSDELLSELISSYTAEAGVRQLQRAIASLCRKAAKKLAEQGECQMAPTVAELPELLGRKVAEYEIATDSELVGVVNGLAWTSAGGDTLQIEVAVCAGSGKLDLTGSLGDVMQESARTAIGHLRTHGERYGLSDIDWDNINIHIHVPEGAVPKDGPSAGVTMTTALVSALSRRAVRQKLAMTGEITLTGRVLPIGGLREKLLAASRATITQVIIPKRNEPDLKDVPKEILDKLSIVTAENMTDIYSDVFAPASVQSYI